MQPAPPSALPSAGPQGKEEVGKARARSAKSAGSSEGKGDAADMPPWLTPQIAALASKGIVLPTKGAPTKGAPAKGTSKGKQPVVLDSMTPILTRTRACKGKVAPVLAESVASSTAAVGMDPWEAMFAECAAMFAESAAPNAGASAPSAAAPAESAAGVQHSSSDALVSVESAISKLRSHVDALNDRLDGIVDQIKTLEADNKYVDDLNDRLDGVVDRIETLEHDNHHHHDIS